MIQSIMKISVKHRWLQAFVWSDIKPLLWVQATAVPREESIIKSGFQMCWHTSAAFKREFCNYKLNCTAFTVIKLLMVFQVIKKLEASTPPL